MIQSLENNLKETDAQKTLVTAFTIVITMKICDLYDADLTVDAKQSVCKALLVHPLEDQKTCMELEFINKHYPDKR